MINIQTLIQAPKDYDTMVSRQTQASDYRVDGIVINKKSKKAYNINIHLNTPKMTNKSEVKVSCSCDDFQYRWAYVLSEKAALLNPKKYVLTPPNKTNPDQKMNACKHIHTFIYNELAGKLKNFSTKTNQI